MALPAAIFILLLALRDRPAFAYALSPGAFDLAAAGRSAAAAAFAILLATSAAMGLKGIGRRIFERLVPESPPWRGPFELALGLALSGPTLLAFGLTGFYTRTALCILTTLLSLLGLLEIRRLRFRIPGPPKGPWAGVFAGIAAFALFDAVCRALAPPLDADVLTYHLALPEMYLRAGNTFGISWNLFSHWPHAVDLLYGLGLAAGSDSSAALLHGVFCAALVFAVHRAALEELGAEAALWAFAILCVQPVLVRQAGGAMVDGALALLYFCSALGLWRWFLSGLTGWAAAAGILAGGAAAVKLHGLILFGFLASAALFAALRDGRRRMPGVTAFFGAAVLTGAPFYLKTWISTGNPLWPMFPSVFGGDFGGPTVAAWLSAFARPRLPDAAVLRFIFLDDGALFLLLPVAFVLAASLARRARWPPVLAFLLVPFPIYFALWLTLSISAWRYCLPFFPALAVLFGWGASVSMPPGLRRAALLAALLPVLGLSQTPALFPLLALSSRRDPQASPRLAFLRASLPFQAMREAIDARLGEADRVLLVGDSQVYGLKAKAMFGAPFHQGLLRYSEIAGEDELYSELRRLEITFVSVNVSGDWEADALRRHDPRAAALIDAAMSRHAVLAAEAGGRRLYRLR